MSDDLMINKVAAAVLSAGIVYMVVGLVGEHLVSPKPLSKNAYVVEGVAEKAADKGGEAASGAAEAAIAPVSPLLAKASAADGEGISKKCATCHNLAKDAPNKVGPNLWGIVNRPHAAAAGFTYSDALMKFAGQPWSYEELNHFLAAPKSYAPGTKMSFAGLAKVEDRANLIAYLRTLADSPQPLP